MIPVSLSFVLALLLRILAGKERFHYDPELGHSALTWIFGLISAFLLLHLLAGTARMRARGRVGEDAWVEPTWVFPLRSILPLLPLVMYGLTLFQGGWLIWIEVSIDPRSEFVRESFAILPYLWFEVLSLLGALRLHGTPRPSWIRLRLVLVALPLWAGVWIVQDLLPLHGGARAMLDELPLAVPASMLLTVLVLLPLAPLWVRWLYDTGPLPHPEYETALASIARRIGLRFHRYGMLREDIGSPEPLVLRGFTRQVFVPRRALESFRGDELEVLFVSALKRSKRWVDFRLCVLSLLLPLAFFSLFEMGVSSQIDPMVGLIVIGAFVFLLIGLLAYFFRRYAFEADLETARELGQDLCEDCLASLVARGEDPGPRLFTLGLEERQEFLVESRSSDTFGRLFRRANRFSELILLVLVFLALGVTRTAWQARWGQAWPSYELSRGEVSQAEQTLEDQLARYRQRRRRQEGRLAEEEGILIESSRSRDEDAYAWAEHLRDLVSRARLLIHEDGDEGNLPLLRKRALARARLALLRGQRASRRRERVTGLDGKAARNASFEQAFAWFELARRWGLDRSPIEAIQLGLVSRLFEDQRGLRRSEYLLRRLDVPAELDDSVRIVFGS